MDAPYRANPRAIDRALGDLDGLLVETDPVRVRRRSRDFFWYSPILNEDLAKASADAIVTPRDEAELIRLIRVAVAHRVPLTPAGARTGNYGQAVPLAGGFSVDMTALTGIEWIRPGHVRVAAGTNMGALDAALRMTGVELRMHPSTKRTATIGGYICGGSGGVGSVTWGGLREPGNILAARVVTVEDEPRVLELRADAAQKVNRAYGTTGFVTALELPTAPAQAWRDVIVAFDGFEAAVDAALAAGHADGIAKKLLSTIVAPLPGYWRDLAAHVPEGAHVIAAMIAEPSMEVFAALMAAHGGRITLDRPSDESAGATPLYEYTWNHTTLQVLKVDRSHSYLQCLYPPDRLRASILDMHRAFHPEVMAHLEVIRFGGRVTCSALPVMKFTSRERTAEIIAAHEAAGVMIANPHVTGLEGGSRHKRADADQLGFKHEVDPYGLLNPGKMESFAPRRT